MQVPSTQEIADQNLARLEAALAQTSPLHDKAFLRVLAVLEALMATGIYKVAVTQALQVLALTATGDGLRRIGSGEGRGTNQKAAEFAQLSITIPAAEGTTVNAAAAFIGDSNGTRYVADGPADSVGGTATLSVTAESAGVGGNLQPGDTLSIVSPQAGIGAVATVASVLNTGADEEDQEAYRLRVLSALRTTHGGGNAADHKGWAEEVAGVYQAFVYGGKPVALGPTSYPGDRSVFIQCTSDLDPDGIPSEALLAEVRSALNISPDTGKSRPGLGLTDDTLYVEPITRSTVDVTITGLATPDGMTASVHSALEAGLTSFILLFRPFIEGVDLPQDRNDQVTNPALSSVVQEILISTGSSAAGVSFTVGDDPYDVYLLGQGERVKLGSVTYAAG